MLQPQVLLFLNLGNVCILILAVDFLTDQQVAISQTAVYSMTSDCDSS